MTGVQTCALPISGLSAALGAVFRSIRGAAGFTTLLCFALTASPFWGNLLIRWVGAGLKSLAIDFVACVTPIAACADAARYDLFRGRALYTLSVVSDYPHAFAAWWLYALIAGVAGILLLSLAAIIHPARRPSAS